MKCPRTLAAALTATVTAACVVGIAGAAEAVPTICTDRGYTNGRHVTIDNDNNGGGAYVDANICWRRIGNGNYYTLTRYHVWDTKANGAGATPRLEWTGLDSGNPYYFVPDSQYRAWNNGDTVSAEIEYNNIQGLYIRACLTNGNRPAHHCGPKA
ncbi:hypothetical protein ACGFNU_47950 [Spirillospora sp. NPDC048911]|uniref:hypothetical protein n=1 Tax=Spirillospora sp. NPDC048911 TaxID=3364527 RepID=UPI00371CE4A8